MERGADSPDATVRSGRVPDLAGLHSTSGRSRLWRGQVVKWLVDRNIAPHVPVWDKSSSRSASCRGPISTSSRSAFPPSSRKKGYRLRYVEFSAGLEANNAVFKGEMQHTIFLDSYNERQKTDLVGIVHVPTPPMGLYSKKHLPGTQIKPGATVAVPNDPVDGEPALFRSLSLQGHSMSRFGQRDQVRRSVQARHGEDRRQGSSLRGK
jgi:NlpA lipoprotein